LALEQRHKCASDPSDQSLPTTTINCETLGVANCERPPELHYLSAKDKSLTLRRGEKIRLELAGSAAAFAGMSEKAA